MQKSKLDTQSRGIDHIALFTNDVGATQSVIEKELKVTFADGGGHPSMGTINRLLSFGERSYLEVVGPAKGAPAGALARKIAEFTPEPELLMFAVETDNAPELADQFRQKGWELSFWEEERLRPDGELLKYRGFSFLNHPWGGLLPFFIDWQASPQPGITSPGGVTLSLAACTTDPWGLQAVYDALAINVSVRLGNKSFLYAEIRSDLGSMVLHGAAETYAKFGKLAELED
ncbi:VOC family protein [Parasphingorhabdus sp.]|uniref:VOC family protein n=1 Tax=Parasphingorhabdus sp. TaxID=2709688 RepID=UPI0032EED215